MPKLRIVRLGSTEPTIDITAMPATLDELSLRGLSTRIVGTARPKHLSLAATSVPSIDGSWSTEGVEWLTLAMPAIPSWIRTSTSLARLSIDCDASDAEVEALLTTCGDELEAVHLRRQRVTDRILHVLARFPKLSFLDVVDTHVTNEALRAFVAKRPNVRALPKLK
jgi:hypothetical protein